MQEVRLRKLFTNDNRFTQGSIHSQLCCNENIKLTQSTIINVYTAMQKEQMNIFVLLILCLSICFSDILALIDG